MCLGDKEIYSIKYILEHRRMSGLGEKLNKLILQKIKNHEAVLLQ